MKGQLAGIAATGAAFLLMAAPVFAAPGRPGMGTPQYLMQLSQNQNFNNSYGQFFQNFGRANRQQRMQVYSQVCNSNQTNQMMVNHLRMDKDANMQMLDQQGSTYTQMANYWSQQGRDTTQLRNDLDTMQQKVNQLGSDYDSLINQWNSVVNSGQQATPQQGQIQPLLNKVNNDLQDIRNFLGQNIQQDLYKVVNSQPNVNPTPTPTPNP